MSVTLTKQPAAIAFSGDNIRAEFTSDSFMDNAGAYAVNSIYIPGSNISPGALIEIRYGSTEVIMTAAEFPDDSGYQFIAAPEGVSGFPGYQLQYFANNYQLSKDFIIEANGFSIKLTAKKKGAAYNIATYNQVSGAAEVAKSNYGIVFSLFLQNADHTGFDEIYTTRLPLQQSGKMEAILNDKIHNALWAEVRAANPEKPDNSMHCKRTSRKYYFTWAESYGNPLVVRKQFSSPEYVAIHGDLSYQGRILEDLSELIAPGTIQNDRFLTQAQPIGMTRSNQQQYLYFFNTRATKNIQVKCKFYFRDGTDQTLNLYAMEILEANKYAFNVTFDKIFVPADFPDMVVTKYDIFLANAADQSRASEIRTFVLDYSAKQYVRYFLNYSSWGGLDSRMFFGKGSMEFELSQSEAEKAAVDITDLQRGTSLVFGVSLRTKYTLTTGFMPSRDALLFNRDFFLSALKYRVVKNKILPIKVSSKNIKELQDGENLLAQEFEYEFLFEDSAYTDGDIDEPGLILEGITTGDLRRDSVKIYDYYNALLATVEAPGEYHITEPPGGEPPTFAYVIADNNHLVL